MYIMHAHLHVSICRGGTRIFIGGGGGARDYVRARMHITSAKLEVPFTAGVLMLSRAAI